MFFTSQKAVPRHMKLFEITAVLMVLTALFSYINYRVLRMPTTIGVMFIALVVSLEIVTLGWLGLDIGQASVARILETIDFNQAGYMACYRFFSLPGQCILSLKI